ncbi:uncharacterized protein G2W53_019544 [Senna tora]|uniref:Uncharacterized protein n=1 Tax=Senna tora TaxID=362788 RepID=A0A834WM27_9FABA|nr:uncharacterized protein G2W53_019544 [Senna tora]
MDAESKADSSNLASNVTSLN